MLPIFDFINNFINSIVVELFDIKVKLTILPLDLDDVCAGESAESSSDLIGRNYALIIGNHEESIKNDFLYRLCMYKYIYIYIYIYQYRDLYQYLYTQF